jgi:anti-anti-sigma regulatory factor
METTMPTQTVIRPAEELGPVLAGRGLATTLRERVEGALASGDAVVIDFEGVEAMSPSFADELFAKLGVTLDDERLRFENLDDDLRSLARFVIEGRSESGS